MHWLVFLLLVMLTTFLVGYIFVRPDRTTPNGIESFPSLWDKFISWPSKQEALQNILDGKPADTPINRYSNGPDPYMYEDVERHPNVWEPMEQYEEIPTQYRARPPQWVSVETHVGERPASDAELRQIIDTMRPTAAELNLIAQMAQQGQLSAAQAQAIAGQHSGYSMGASVAPRNPKTPENFIKELNKKANEAANPKQPQSIDRFDKIEE